MRVFILPIEPQDQRYSAQWLEWFPAGFRKLGCEVQIVNGDTLRGRSADTGTQAGFLDPLATNYYKATQLANFVSFVRGGQVSDGDWVFLFDGWDPCVEQLAYIRDLSGPKFLIASCFHAGAYDPTDLLGYTPSVHHWAQHADKAHVSAADVVFVATDYHKDLIGKIVDDEQRWRIISSGFPLEIDYRYAKTWDDREPVVVWPHRISPDKQPGVWQQIIASYEEQYPRDHARFIRTRDRKLDKAAYYTLMGGARAVVSTALHENWGIAMLEGAALGAYPIVPARASYGELYSRNYVGVAEAARQIHDAVTARDEYEQDMRAWEPRHVFTKMVAMMRGIRDERVLR